MVSLRKAGYQTLSSKKSLRSPGALVVLRRYCLHGSFGPIKYLDFHLFVPWDTTHATFRRPIHPGGRWNPLWRASWLKICWFLGSSVDFLVDWVGSTSTLSNKLFLFKEKQNLRSPEFSQQLNSKCWTDDLGCYGLNLVLLRKMCLNIMGLQRRVPKTPL